MNTPDTILDPFSRPAVARLPVYVPGKPLAEVQREYGRTDVVKLASNENPIGPSPMAVAAIQAALPELNYYPDNNHYALKKALAAHLQVPEDWLAVGAAGAAMLRLLAEAYIRPGDQVVYPWPSFVLYPFYSALMDAKVVPVPLRPQGIQDTAGLAKAAAGARLVVICNPNNPTGTYVPAAALTDFLANVSPETLVILDEAYFEFARDAAADYPDGIENLRQGHRVAVVRTLSKAYGLAGLRVGYLVAPPDVVLTIRRTRAPFEVSSLAQAAAVAALGDQDHVRRTLQVVRDGRCELAAAFTRLGLRFLPSVANFVFVDVRRPAEDVNDELLRLGVIARPTARPVTWLRVTVGTTGQNQRFVAALEQVLGQGK